MSFVLSSLSEFVVDYVKSTSFSCLDIADSWLKSLSLEQLSSYPDTGRDKSPGLRPYWLCSMV